jgi:poly-gamma-glutamate synthesis protein (capsule biosynthesis protein)
MNKKQKILICCIVSISASAFLLLSKSSKSISFNFGRHTDSVNSRHELTITIGGDVMFDRNVRKLAEANGYEHLLDAVASIFKNADIAVINLEGPVTSFKSRTLLPTGKTTKELTFTFDPQSLKALRNAGISLVSLANNHTNNFGHEGLAETKNNLATSGISYFGNPWNEEPTEFVTEKNGIKVAFVGYNSFQVRFQDVLTTIRNLHSNGYFVIVMPHWGEEYVSAASPALKETAKEMADAGADAIIGSHAHVIMEHELIGDVPVYYSLGNLLFDQFFSPEVMKGNIIELRLSKIGAAGTTTLDEIKIYKTTLDAKTGVNLQPLL